VGDRFHLIYPYIAGSIKVSSGDLGSSGTFNEKDIANASFTTVTNVTNGSIASRATAKGIYVLYSYGSNVKLQFYGFTSAGVKALGNGYLFGSANYMNSMDLEVSKDGKYLLLVTDGPTPIMESYLLDSDGGIKSKTTLSLLLLNYKHFKIDPTSKYVIVASAALQSSIKTYPILSDGTLGAQVSEINSGLSDNITAIDVASIR
jgi:hypothetical protein